MSLQGKVALVTGASRGIGQAIALELGRNGAVVVGTATSEAGAERISATFKENGIEGFGLMLDVCDAASVDAHPAPRDHDQHEPDRLLPDQADADGALHRRALGRIWAANQRR